MYKTRFPQLKRFFPFTRPSLSQRPSLTLEKLKLNLNPFTRIVNQTLPREILGLEQQLPSQLVPMYQIRPHIIATQIRVTVAMLLENFEPKAKLLAVPWSVPLRLMKPDVKKLET